MNKQINLPESQQKIQEKLDEIYKKKDEQKSRLDFLSGLSDADQFLMRATSMKFVCESEGFEYWRESEMCEKLSAYVDILQIILFHSDVEALKKYVEIFTKGIKETNEIPEKPPARPETFRSEALAEEWEKKHGEIEKKYDEFLDKMTDIFDEYMELFQINENFDNDFFDLIYKIYLKKVKTN